jgi:orotidine-5'-phosphate decarboxylase
MRFTIFAQPLHHAEQAAEAIREGTDYIGIGRQITRAAGPAREVARLLDEIHVVARPAPSR